MIASTHRIHLAQIPRLRKMRTQTGFGTAGTNPAQGAQTARKAQDGHAQRLGEPWRQAVEHNGRVVEDVGRKSVPFAFGLEGGAKPMRKQDGGDAAG